MAFQVYSEVGRLRRVLIHRPGLEIDWMVPAMMERLLFDDILHSDEARQEHETFQRVFEAAEVTTYDSQDLLVETLAAAEARAELFERLEREQLISGEVRLELEAMEAPTLAKALVTGIRARRERLGEKLRSFYRLPPVPNYFFQRDPQAVLGNRVLIAAMATEARAREAHLAETNFRFHPALAGHRGLIAIEKPELAHGGRRPTIEGGDLLVASSEVLLVGHSERTNRRGINALARHLRSEPGSFRHLIVVEMPAKRSYMHLDTIFTFIDRGLCLGYLPVIARGGAEAGHVYRVDLAAPDFSYTVCNDLPTALAEVGLPVEIIPCGGSESLIDQQREQWTDGANAFAIAPGVILIYQRNRRTVEELARHDFRVLAAKDVVEGGEKVLGQGRTVITLPDHELSRARGGPRCMTMPLERDELE